MQKNIIIPIRDWNEVKSRLASIESKLDSLLSGEQKEMLTPAEVCGILNISRDTYQRYVKYRRKCKAKGCREKAVQNGYCSYHAGQIQSKAIRALLNNRKQ